MGRGLVRSRTGLRPAPRLRLAALEVFAERRAQPFRPRRVALAVPGPGFGLLPSLPDMVECLIIDAWFMSSLDTGPLRMRTLVSAACCARDLRSFFRVALPVKRGAERRKAQGFARPLGPVRTALNTLARRIRVPLRSGTLASRRSTTAIFVGPCSTRLGPRLLSGHNGRPVVQLAPSFRVILPERRGPRRPESPAGQAEPAGAVPASYQSRPTG